MESRHVDFLRKMIKAGFAGEPLTDHFVSELKREEERTAKHARMAKLVSSLKAKAAAGAGR